MTFSSLVLRLIPCAFALAAAVVRAEPLREWDWHMPARVYKELDFTDRAGVDRAVKLFERAVEAERRNTKVTDLVPMYRAAAGEWRKVQVQAETAGGNEALLAYAIFMQGYAKQQARDRNEAVKIFNEVLDIYPEEKFIAVPARYMISVVKRELGNVRQANADLEAIVEDGGADGHPIYYNVLRSLAANRWAANRTTEAAELWEKIVFTKGSVDWNLKCWSRDDLIAARVVNLDFGNLLPVILVNVSQKPADRRNALTGNANWASEIDTYWHHSVTRYLDAHYPKDKKGSERKAKIEKMRRGYAAWFETVASNYDGCDDGWTVSMLRLKLNRFFEKPEAVQKRVRSLEGLVKGGKTPDQVNGRARELSKFLVGIGQGDSARNIAALAREAAYRLRLQYEIEDSLRQWKAAAMYLEELVNLKPAPAEDALRGAKYDLAWYCRNRLNTPEKAVKLYQEINDPPRSLWGLCEAQRQCGKKNDSYTTLTEIVSIFPNDAPDAVYRMAEWREQDGEKEKAIGLYRQLLKHPKWKQSNASSRAHQALERLGIATGGAMTNEVR